MSFESRLKANLEDRANAVTPDVGTALVAVRRRHTTRRRVRVAAYSAGLAGVVALAILGGAQVLHLTTDDGIPPSAPRHRPVPVDYSTISGDYAARIGERPGLVRTYKLDGRWTLHLSTKGDIELTAPTGFVRFLGPVSEARFTLVGDRFRTDVMTHEGVGCTGDATYAWTLVGVTLRLTPVDDACPYRPTVLGSKWTRLDQGAE